MTFSKDSVSAEKVPWFRWSAESSNDENLHVFKWPAV